MTDTEEAFVCNVLVPDFLLFAVAAVTMFVGLLAIFSL